MGWDISYHPFGKEEVKSIYFALLENPALLPQVVEQFGVNEFYAERLKEFLDQARESQEVAPFNKTHAYHLAIVAGFLRKYWYIRGGALSFLAEDEQFSKYFSDWRQLVPPKYQGLPFDNALTENYCGGVFVSHEALKQMKSDYESVASVKEKLDELFSDGRLAVFWKAADYAFDNGLGLVEAAEVIEPDPFDLNKGTRCCSNLFNCDPEGALLFQEAAMQQIAEATGSNPPTPPNPSELAKKRGFFSRLFGKSK